MVNDKYSLELEKEMTSIKNKNPFKKKSPSTSFNNKPSSLEVRPHYEPKEKSTGYFNLILDSDHQDIEMEIRGLKYVSYHDPVTQKDKVRLERRNNHYLSEEGAEEIMTEIKGHLSSDIKLGFMREDEFLKTQDIIRKSFIGYVKQNLQRLGMDTEAKQRRARPLIVMILNRIRAVYSRSIRGKENERSHGDINLSGGLDGERESKFRLEETKN